MASSANDTAPAANQSTTPAIHVIYHNMHTGSDFRTFRASTNHSLNSHIATVAKHVADDCYTMINLNISTYSVVIWPIMYEPILGAYTESYAGWSLGINLKNSGAFIIPWVRIGRQRADIEEAKEERYDGGMNRAERFWKWCQAQSTGY
ncbi:hypothetical protein DL98DRAFT_652060 [Cadophora sp. DSE1049]|nr:hypothetical protein DL98DRAFT_652060 [Cadophora sp. DSE1049]